MAYEAQLLAFAESVGKQAEAMSALVDELARAVTANERNIFLLQTRIDSLEKTLHDRTDHLA